MRFNDQFGMRTNHILMVSEHDSEFPSYYASEPDNWIHNFCKRSKWSGLRRIALGLLFVFAVTIFPQIAIAQDDQRVVPQNHEQLIFSFADVVKVAAPSVVNVYATRLGEEQISPFADDPLFERFFGENSPLAQAQREEIYSLGSGVIIDSGGIVLTNFHVIDGATEVKISLANGRQFEVELVLADERTDLAVLRILSSGSRAFPALEFANSDNLEVGDLVLAIGNPFGVGQTVTSGIVSALARAGVGALDYQFFIQTDAAINPGNSGGALVNMAGELLGINSAIYSRSGGSNGIGFAVPSNMARIIAEAAIAGGDIVRPWFGADMRNVDTELADNLGMEAPTGVVVSRVQNDSPAGRARLQDGDVILSIDDVEVRNLSEFNYRFSTKPVGGQAVVTYIRDGRMAEALVDLLAEPAGERTQTMSIGGRSRFAGVTVVQLTLAVANGLGLPPSSSGVVIVEVEKDSRAASIGLLRGDIFLQLNANPIPNLAAFSAQISQSPEFWRITIERDGEIVRSLVSK